MAAASAPPAPPDRCPRCGATFHCGATDPAPCACTQWRLGAELLARLREQYTGCLCGACLRELSRAEEAAR